MIELTPKNIQLHARAGNKEEAIREAGRLLVELGCIDPGYIESMLAREQQANTFLGNGIAIPHGLQKDRELIHRTGVAVVQVPLGVEWNPGQIVRVIIGIAAKSDEHIEVLAALTDVLDNDSMAAQLAQTSSAAEIILGLTARQQAATVVEELAGADFVDVFVSGKAGLHARPATHFAELANTFASTIQVRFKDKAANGKSMASLLKLGVHGGATIRLLASGPDSQEALRALAAAVADGLGESEETEAAIIPAAHWEPVIPGISLEGVSGAPGVGIGPVFHYGVERIETSEDSRGADVESAALRHALADAAAELQAIQADVEQRSGKGQAAIFRAHLALLNDAELLDEVYLKIDSGKSAAWSWQQAIERRVAEFRQIENERLAERAADWNDVGRRVLRLLAGVKNEGPVLPATPSILVAEDLAPSDTARLDPALVLAICTAGGGPTAHTAIIARSLDIPAIVGLGAAVHDIPAGTVCIADGAAGRLYTAPTAEDLESARKFQQTLADRSNEAHSGRFAPALMLDGHRVEVVANIGKLSEAAAAVEAGAEGVGLMRTEFLFLDRDEPASEDEQTEIYSGMIRALNGLPLILRTLDIGGDKLASYITLPKEENPFLGVRGIRLCLQQPDLFLPQLRAIYRAALTGPVRIMFPMISTLEDLRAAKELAETVRAQVGAPPVEIGIMIEVPSSVIMAPELAREVDFFSIGTNDLTQYALAMDRLHPTLGKNVDGLHPAVLRLIDMTVRAAKAAGKWVGVCGGIAGEPLGAALLTGLGVEELSMSLPSVPAVKAHLRKLRFTEAADMARRALACSTAAEVRNLGK